MTLRFLERLAFVTLASVTCVPAPCSAAESIHFNPDTDPSRLDWTQLEAVLGPAPDVRGARFGIVIKTQTNEYWRLMGAGYRKRAAADGIKLDIQAAQNENDPIRQLSSMENMIGARYRAILVSPQSASNLQPAVDDAMAAGIPLVDVDGAVVDSIPYFVGAMNRDMGVKVAKWFIDHSPAGGKLAVIEGRAGVFSTVQRSAGFRETISAVKGFEIVASVAGDWDRQQSYDATLSVLDKYPDVVGFYCNNDVMALGVVDAVKSRGLVDKINVFGTDGTTLAYDSIRAGELTGTVAIFPALVGEIGLDVAERISAGQRVPRVIVTPQALVTRENIAEFTGDEKALLDGLSKTSR